MNYLSDEYVQTEHSEEEVNLRCVLTVRDCDDGNLLLEFHHGDQWRLGGRLRERALAALRDYDRAKSQGAGHTLSPRNYPTAG